MSSSQPHINRPVVLGTMILASMAAVMSTDMYAPSLAALPEILGTNASMVQITMGINALFFGLAQLIHGPLADRFGRRPVMLCGVALFALFSLLCGMAQTVEQLIIARALQGAAASVEAVLLLAIIGDIFAPKDRPKAFAIYGAVWSVAPAIAPIIGGHVHELLGWQWNFYIICGLCLIAFSLSLVFLQETGTPDPDALRLKRILRNYGGLLRHRNFIGLTLLMSLPLAAILVYITAAPFILQEKFGFSVTQVGYFQAAMVVAYMLASALSGKLASSVEHASLLKAGVVLTVLGMVISASILLSGYASPALILAGMIVFTMGFGPLFSVTPGMIMELSPNSRGTAAALLGAVEMMIAGVAIALLSSFNHEAMTATAITFVVISICILLISACKPWWIVNTEA